MPAPTELDFPLPPIDAEGQTLVVGNNVRILSVASCTKGLPTEDQARLSSLVGQIRPLLEIDHFGFVWFPFAEADIGPGFCLLPTEVSLVARSNLSFKRDALKRAP